MSSFFNRLFADLFDFHRWKWWYFTMLICFSSGIILGIFVRSEDFLDVIGFLSTDYFLVIFGKDSISSIFVSRCLNNLTMIVILSICFFTKYLIPLNYLFLCYRGFVFGSVIFYVGMSFGVAGVLLVIFLIIPIQFISNFIFIIASVNAITYAKKRYCDSIWIFVLSVATVFLLSVLSAVLESAIVVIIIRPLNFVM